LKDKNETEDIKRKENTEHYKKNKKSDIEVKNLFDENYLCEEKKKFINIKEKNKEVFRI
jgi:hypothetical protein